MMRKLLSLLLPAALAACGSGGEPAAPPSTSTAEATPAPSPSASASETPAPAEQGQLDYAALEERKDPRRVLTFFAEAVAQGKWDDAARAWRKDGMTGAKLKESFGLHRDYSLTFGNGEAEGAAGSLYYQVPVELTADGHTFEREGIITLRRVNDVPGAEDWQLAWHIETLDWEN